MLLGYLEMKRKFWLLSSSKQRSILFLAFEMDPENFLSFLALIGLLTTCYFSAGRMMQPGGEKLAGSRMAYSHDAAA